MRTSSMTTFILVLIAVVAPFTALRFSFFGIAELLVLLLVLMQLGATLRMRSLREFHLTKFWLLYVGVCVLGWIVNVMLLERQTGAVDAMVFDLASYVFILLACFAMEMLASHGRIDLGKFLRHVFFYSSGTLALLYLVSFYTPTLLGLPLKYYDYFAPLAENLHQVSMFLVTLPFLGVAAYRFECSRVRRVLIFPLVGVDIMMSFSTGSTKASMAIVIGLAALSYAYAIGVFGRRRALAVALTFCVISIPAFVYFDAPSFARSFFLENDGGGARQYLYSQALDVAARSIIVGHGPGGHIDYSGFGAYSDAHNTFLTALLQAGLIGLVAFVILMVKAFRLVLHHPPLLGAFVAILIYAAGGDILRRLPVWIVLFAIIHFSIALRARERASARSSADAQAVPGVIA